MARPKPSIAETRKSALDQAGKLADVLVIEIPSMRRIQHVDAVARRIS